MSKEDGTESPQDPSQASKIKALLQEWDNLLSELRNFQAYLRTKELEHTVDLRVFQSRTLAERRKLEKLDPYSPSSVHAVNSTNFPFYCAVWAAAKASHGLVQINKRVDWEPRNSHRRAKRELRRKASVLVDIVADGGAEWVKVSTITANRLLFEKAKAGWESSSGHGSDESGGEQEDDRVSLLKIALDLRRASRSRFVRYVGKHPRIRFVLPRIQAGAVPEIDAILDLIRDTGASVQCAQDLPILETTLNTQDQPSSLESVYERLLLNPHAHLTSTINIDCTVLLALISDLSHAKIEPEPWFSGSIKRQLELEAKEQLLPKSLWPAMRGRNMVCTAHAAERMREIVETLATPTERTRMELLLGEGNAGSGKDGNDLVGRFQKLSIYSVPKDWKLPVRVVEDEVDVKQLPECFEKAWLELTPINRSVFLWGWATGYTTFTSNGTVARLVQRMADAAVEKEDIEGPRIWLCDTARSLVGKEKGKAS